VRRMGENPLSDKGAGIPPSATLVAVPIVAV
jgi:hypothetical protein